ncbi:hypothetical protein DOO78_15655 [Roseicella frigidaeris]|uniref:Uncharacterized protein n=1 Tax=Roseicella frigidaeris TaxID=2230885 RepID=A0A327M778_9PROT|nr:hypothetical protein DOO78_15655 [Roseicella frigidaeris]
MVAALPRPEIRLPEKEPRRRPDLVGLIGLAVILAVLGGAYLLFPVVQRAISYQDCIASGRITGC